MSVDPIRLGAGSLKIADIEVIKWTPGAGKNFIYIKLSTDAGITSCVEATKRSAIDLHCAVSGIEIAMWDIVSKGLVNQSTTYSAPLFDLIFVSMQPVGQPVARAIRLCSRNLTIHTGQSMATPSTENAGDVLDPMGGHAGSIISLAQRP